MSQEWSRVVSAEVKKTLQCIQTHCSQLTPQNKKTVKSHLSLTLMRVKLVLHIIYTSEPRDLGRVIKIGQARNQWEEKCDDTMEKGNLHTLGRWCEDYTPTLHYTARVTLCQITRALYSEHSAQVASFIIPSSHYQPSPPTEETQ